MGNLLFQQSGLAVGLCIVSACSSVGGSTDGSFYDRAADPHRFTVFMENGGWCWFQDPRAIVHQDHVLIGSVQGNGSGPALVGVYDLAANQPLGASVMQDDFDRDDHNSPVFHVRGDGSVLAVYARHGREKVHYSRISQSDDFMEWGPEMVHERPSPNPRDNVTYMNLYELADEGLLYNFYRGIEYNPSFVTSGDGGLTWSEPKHFFTSVAEGRHRPYPRYHANGQDTIYVSVTDGHPRNFGNSIYYFEFRDGRFYRADGTLIKELATEGPLRPDEADCVFRGPMTTEKPAGYGSVPDAAWTSSITTDAEGRPHIAYSVYRSDQDQRYRLASWDGERWIDREIAHGGASLYPREASYSGLVTLDPQDPRVVFISSDVDPSTGEPKGPHGQHEIYRARINPEDSRETIQWEPVTRDSPVRNLRPMILRDGGQRIVLWQRGVYKTYLDYDLDTVGFIESVD